MDQQGNRLILGVTVTSLGLVVALPILFIVLEAVFPHFAESSFKEPFATFRDVFADRRLPELFFNTLLLGVGVAVGCLLIAMPLAVLRASGRVPLAGLWDVLFLIPFMIPPYIGAFAWILTLQPNGYSQQLFGFNAGAFLFSSKGIISVMALHMFPVVYFALSYTLSVVGQRFADAGRTCGATPLLALRRITLPLSLPGLAASLLLVFALTIEEFGTPATLGTRSQFLVLVTGIEEKYAEWPIDPPGAAVLSLILVALALAAFALQHWIATRRSYIAVSGKQGLQSMGSERRSIVALALFMAVAFIAVILPIAAVTMTAFSRTLSGGLTPGNLGLQNFRTVLDNADGALDALGTSLWLSAAAALIAGALGLLTAYVTVRTTLRGRAVVDGLSILPNALPGIVIAVGMILAWNRSWWPVAIYNTPVVLLLAYVCLLLPYPVRYVAAGLRQVSGSLDAAARVSGAGQMMVLRRIIVPLIAPQLMVAMLLVFAIASRELIASVMLAPSGMKTVATYVFNQFAQGSPGVGMALSVIAIFASTAVLVTVGSFTRALIR